MRKPATLKLFKREIATVFTDFYGDQFAEEGDPINMKVDVNYFDDSMFDGFTPAEQIKLCRKFAPWLLKYADWVEYQVANEERLNIRVEG